MRTDSARRRNWYASTQFEAQGVGPRFPMAGEVSEDRQLPPTNPTPQPRDLRDDRGGRS